MFILRSFEYCINANLIIINENKLHQFQLTEYMSLLLFIFLFDVHFY